MLIVYETKAVPVQTFDVNTTCPACKVNSVISFYVYSEYVKVFLIPFIPTDKLAISRCANCKQSYATKFLPGLNVFNEMTVTPIMPMELSAFFYKRKKAIWPRWWEFTGVALIFLAIALTFVNEVVKDSRTEAYFKDPEAGDVYQIRLDDDAYTTFRIQKVTSDTLFVFFNDWIVDGEKGLEKLEAKPFAEEISPVSRVDLGEMKKQFKIRRIVRED
jgi:hypothetical protein